METRVDLEQAMELAANEFQKITRHNLYGDFIQQEKHFRETMNGKIDDPSTADNVASILKCCVSLANVAASGASAVFPAGSACVSGLSFLLDGVQTYRAFYRLPGIEEIIENLMDSLVFVKRTRDAAETNGITLSNEINSKLVDIIIDFLQICTSYGKMKKIKASANPVSHLDLFARAMLGLDYGGIKRKLKHIESLTGAVQNFKNDDVHAMTTSLSSTQAHHEYRKEIMESLQCKENGNWKTWVEAAFDLHRQEFAPEAAMWLHKDSAFQEWSSANTAKRILVIQSSHNESGKSSICAEAIARLREMHVDCPARKAPALCYFFFKPVPGSPLLGDKPGREAQLEDALKSIAWQFCQTSKSYQGYLATKCRPMPCSADTLSTVWQAWLTNYVPPNAAQTIFIVLDGIDQAILEGKGSEKALRSIIRQVSEPATGTGRLDIRLLLSCRDRYITEQIPEGERKAMSFINLADHRQEMVETLIEKELDSVLRNFNINQDAKDNWRRQQRKALRKHSRNDLGMLSTIFRQIHLKNISWSSLIQFDNSLDDVMKNYKTELSAHIQALDHRLPEEEIEDLNEIIACIVLMKQCPTLAQIRDVIGIRQESQWTLGDQPLRKKLQCYGRLVNVAGDIVSSQETKDHFLELESVSRKKGSLAHRKEPLQKVPTWLYKQNSEIRAGAPVETGQSSEQDAVVQASKFLQDAAAQGSKDVSDGPEIHESEIAIVKQVLVMVCGKELYQRFDFDSFFGTLKQRQQAASRAELEVANASTADSVEQGRATVRRSRISFKTSNGHTRIVCSLLKSLQYHKNADRSTYESLHEYAVENVFQHIKQIDHSFVFDLPKYSQIHRMLVSSFTEQVPIKVWLNHNWRQDKEYLHFQTWLTDAVSTTLEWLNRKYCDKTMTPERLMAEPIKVLSGRWLQDARYPIKLAFAQLAACCEILEVGKVHSESDVGKRIDAVQHTLHRTELWPVNSPSEFPCLAERRLLETFLCYELYHRVIEQSESLLERDKANCHWTVHWYRAQALAKVEENGGQEALKHYKETLRILGDSEFCEQRPENLSEILPAYWTLVEQVEPTEDTVEDFRHACRELLEVFPGDASVIDALIRSMDSDDELQLQLFKQLSETKLPRPQSEITVMTGLLLGRATSLDFHRNVIKCFQKDLEDLKMVYKSAIKASDELDAARYLMRFYLGLALQYQRPPIQDKLLSPRGARLSFRKGVHCGFTIALKSSKKRPKHPTEGLRMWEEDVNMFLEIEKPNGEDGNHGIIHAISQWTAIWLASSYTSMVEQGSESVQKHINTLAQFIEKQDGNMASVDGSDNFLAHSLSRLCHLDNQRDKAHQHVRTSIESGITLLSDSVTHNDWRGCLVLLEALKAVEDDINAKAACGLLYRLIKRGQAPWWFEVRCVGLCENTWPKDFQSIYICRDCADIQFGSCCRRNLGQISRSRLVCGEHHSFLYFTPEDAWKAGSTGEHAVIHDGGTQLSVEKWLSLLRNQYMQPTLVQQHT